MAKWRRSVGEEFYHPDLVDLDAHYAALPAELDPYIYGFLDIGPCVMAILERDFEEAVQDGDLELWELPIPCALFVRLPWRRYGDCIVADAEGFPESVWSRYFEPQLW